MIIIIGGLYEGLGLACAVLLKKRNNQVIIAHSQRTSREIDKVEKLQVKIDNAELGIKVLRYNGIDSLSNIISEYKEECKGIIVANGQRAYDFTDVVNMNKGQLMASIINEIEVCETVAKIQFPLWKKNGGGSLISFGYYKDYWNNHLPLHKGHIYSNDSSLFKISKAAKYELFKCLSNRHSKDRIRLNIIEPGRIKNLSIEELLASVDSTDVSIEQASSLDVAKLCSFLISDEATWITGANIPLLNHPITYGRVNEKY